jgi:seryl-tRNA synthetase
MFKNCSNIEVVRILLPYHSVVEYERMTEAEETILKKLELPIRTLALCPDEMEFAVEKNL